MFITIFLQEENKIPQLALPSAPKLFQPLHPHPHPHPLAGFAAVAFISYTGLESLLGGRFLQDENPGSKARPEHVRVNSRVVSASTSTWKKKISSPINLTFQHLEVGRQRVSSICNSMSWGKGESVINPSRLLWFPAEYGSP